MKPYKDKLDKFFKHTTKPELFNICMLLGFEIANTEKPQYTTEEKKQEAFELLYSARATVRRKEIKK